MIIGHISKSSRQRDCRVRQGQPQGNLRHDPRRDRTRGQARRYRAGDRRDDRRAAEQRPPNNENYGNLTLTTDKRPETDKASFLVKTKLAGGKDAKAALDKIYKFVKDMPAVGRAETEPQGELTLSVVRPDQYRGAIIDLVAADAHATAAKMGPDYAIEAKGLERPVEWSRASLTEVFLYVPYRYDVVPKGR